MLLANDFLNGTDTTDFISQGFCRWSGGRRPPWRRVRLGLCCQRLLRGKQSITFTLRCFSMAAIKSAAQVPPFKPRRFRVKTSPFHVTHVVGLGANLELTGAGQAGGGRGERVPPETTHFLVSAQLRGAPARRSAGRGVFGGRPPSLSLSGPPAGRWGLCSGAQPRPALLSSSCTQSGSLERCTFCPSRYCLLWLSGQ